MPWAKKPRKYLRGPPVLGAYEAVSVIMSGEWLIWRGKPMHPKVMMQLSIATLQASCHHNCLHHAVINPDWTPPEDGIVF